MNNWLLICVIGILIITTINGYSKGAMKISLMLVSSIAGMGLAVILAQPFATFLRNNTGIEKTVQKEIHVFVEGYMKDGFDKKAEDLTGDMLKDLPFPMEIKEMLLENNNKETIGKLGAVNIADYVSKELSKMIVKALAFGILYLIISLAIRIVMSTMDILTKLPVVKEVNKLAGVFVGFLEGMVVVWVSCIVVTGFATTDVGLVIMEQINNSAILSFIYDNNLLLKIIMSVV